MKQLLRDNRSILSFDNLALEQLDIKNCVRTLIWNKCYMGEEGQFSMYIDTVEEKFYKSSTEEVGFDLNDLSLKEIFSRV